jgi:hypothetical protein
MWLWMWGGLMKTWERDELTIPDGYSKLNYGIPMRADDLIWVWDDEMTEESWHLLGEGEEVDFPYNISYRPIVRKGV